MFNQIEKIQQKPESSRRKIAFIASAIITLAIIFVWISVFPSRFNLEKTEVDGVDNITGEAILEVASPFESIKDDMTDIFSNIGGKFDELKEKIKGI